MVGLLVVIAVLLVVLVVLLVIRERHSRSQPNTVARSSYRASR
jgi:hypothetical protein